MSEKKRIFRQVKPEEKDLRLDLFICSKFEKKITRSKAQEAIKNEVVLINGQPGKKNRTLKEGDELSFPENFFCDSKMTLTESTLNLPLIFEDDFLIVINKPAGISVHPSLSDKTKGNSVVESLLSYCKSKGELLWTKEKAEDSLRPGVVHRLDKDTSGALVWCKNKEAFDFLKKQFQEKTNHRNYRCLLDGLLEEKSKTVESIIFRDPKNKIRFTSCLEENLPQESNGRRAKTTFTFLDSYYDRFTLAKASLFTGRTHQIRVHAKEIEMPVLGDPLYNQKKDYPKKIPEKIIKEILSLKRQMLHAETLGFIHPFTKKDVFFKADLPEDFSRMIKILSD